MSLLQNIPGLSRHAPTIAPHVAPVFDLDRAFLLMRQALSLLESSYPAGAMEWLRIHRPDVITHLKERALQVDRAALAEDMPAVIAAVDLYREAHERAFKLYQARPPVIDVDQQGGLF